MPPAVNQEINVNINALVKRIQDVKDLVSTIKELRGQKSGPVLIDEKISHSARTSAGDVDHLSTSIDKLAATIDKIDDSKTGRLGRLLTVFGGIATILGHIKGAHEGLGTIKELAASAPNVSAKLSGAGAAITGFFAAARDKISGAATAVKTKVASIVDELPALAKGLAGGASGLLGIGAAGVVAAGGLFAVLAPIALIVAALASLLALPIITGFLVRLASSAAETGSKFHDLNQQTGVSVELLSSLAPVADDSNGSIDDLAIGIGRFNKVIGEANKGSKDAIATLAQFDLKPKEALNNTDAALEKVIKRIITLPAGTQQAIAAQDAFGKSGARLLPTLIATEGNLEAVKKKAKELGVYWTTDGARAADEFGDRVSEIRRIAEGFALSIGRTLIPELLKLLRIFSSDMPVAGGAFSAILGIIAVQAAIATNAILHLIAAAETLRDVPGIIAAGVATGSPSVAASALGDAFNANLARLTLIANTQGSAGAAPTTPLDFAGKGAGSKKNTTPADTFQSELAFRRAAAQHAFDLDKDFYDRLTEIYQTALDQRKIATEDFYDATSRLRQRALENELQFQHRLETIEQDRLAAEKKKISENQEKKTPRQQAADNTNAEAQFQTAIAPIATRIEQITRDLADLPRLTEAAEKAALNSLDDQISQFLAKVDEANGRTAAAAADAIDREFKQLLERVTIEQGENSPLVKLIQTFIQVQKDRARVAQIDQRLEPLGQQFEIDRLNVEADVSRHVINQREGRRQINVLQREYLRAQLEILKNELANTQEARDQLEIKLKIAVVQADLAAIQDDLDEKAQDINATLKGGTLDFFTSLADGTKNIKDAFADLGDFIRRTFARLASERLVETLFNGVFGDEKGQGGIGGFFSKIFGGGKSKDAPEVADNTVATDQNTAATNALTNAIGGAGFAPGAEPAAAKSGGGLLSKAVGFIKPALGAIFGLFGKKKDPEQQPGSAPGTLERIGEAALPALGGGLAGNSNSLTAATDNLTQALQQNTQALQGNTSAIGGTTDAGSQPSGAETALDLGTSIFSSIFGALTQSQSEGESGDDSGGSGFFAGLLGSLGGGTAGAVTATHSTNLRQAVDSNTTATDKNTLAIKQNAEQQKQGGGGGGGAGGLAALLAGGGGFAVGGDIPAQPGGRLAWIAEAGHDEMVVTTDPRHSVRTSALLGAFIRRTGILPDLSRLAGGAATRSIADSFNPIPLAAGGFVSAAPAAAPGNFANAGAGGDRHLTIKQVNVYDPSHVHDAMRADGGDEVIWNFIDHNAGAIKRRLRI